MLGPKQVIDLSSERNRKAKTMNKYQMYKPINLKELLSSHHLNKSKQNRHSNNRKPATKIKLNLMS